MYQIKGKYTTATLTIDAVEESCIAQINQFVNHPAFTNPVVIMPDTHAGKGSVIGFTMPMTPQVIPNVIGVDIGCGMLSCMIGSSLRGLSFEQLDSDIRDAIPFGMRTHNRAVINLRKEFPWQTIRKTAKAFATHYNQQFGLNIAPEQYEGDDSWFQKKCEQVGADPKRVINSVGTLGGGNHFIEIGIDEATGNYWLTIHTGSRNFGKCVCEYWQRYATKVIRKDKATELSTNIAAIRKSYTGSDIERQIQILRQQCGLDPTVSEQLDFLEGPAAHQYLFDMIFAQAYAVINRKYISELICKLLGIDCCKDQIECVHNFIDFEDLIIRKGAIRAYENERMVIPFNMRDGLLICRGKSNPAWNLSAPHGAGRILSRSAAKKSVDLETFKQAMTGIFSTSVGRGTLDESPMAYKDADMIEQAIAPTAEILMRIKPVHNLKDSEGHND